MKLYSEISGILFAKYCTKWCTECEQRYNIIHLHRLAGPYMKTYINTALVWHDWANS